MGKKSQPPPAPDYTALAEQTAASAKEAAQATTTANRPDQTDIYGNTSKWTQDPTTGQWSQTQALGQSGQATLDRQQELQGQLTDQLADSFNNPLTTEGLPESNIDAVRAKTGLFNMDPVGNSQDIQDATYKLLQPGRQQEREGEVQRLKNQGLTEDSPAFQRAMTRLDQGDTDAGLKSLLAGRQEYGQQFGRGLEASQQGYQQTSDTEKLANALRSAGLGERALIREQPMDDLTKVMAVQGASSPQFGSFMGATGSGGTDYLGAGKSQQADAMAAYNAQQQRSSGMLSGLMGLGGAILGGPVGGFAGSALGSYLK